MKAFDGEFPKKTTDLRIFQALEDAKDEPSYSLQEVLKDFGLEKLRED